MDSKKHLRKMISSLLEQDFAKAQVHLESCVKTKIQKRYDVVYEQVCKTMTSDSLNS